MVVVDGGAATVDVVDVDGGGDVEGKSLGEGSGGEVMFVDGQNGSNAVAKALNALTMASAERKKARRGGNE